MERLIITQQDLENVFKEWYSESIGKDYTIADNSDAETSAKNGAAYMFEKLSEINSTQIEILSATEPTNLDIKTAFERLNNSM